MAAVLRVPSSSVLRRVALTFLKRRFTFCNSVAWTNTSSHLVVLTRIVDSADIAGS
ncbi:hypothetical protein MT49_3978 [Mycobacterium tuberculosis 49-02]|uniref:Uncharacterized protein n=1 Tax=Mycobacterium tuberculosis TaxID=1773 RepID=A0A654U776_MYCTX|nr:hypothetical protein MT49_3978 [Mycobacterium tuberculosis 49-02]CFS13560.1 Uncharacterised protein [Mycobacterium tuberculosis]CFS47569.1 Uncharacterised protein [Mycobacterium tuberculosis]COZ83151.1 Uncharacterised protein [Mycobacterium tuberculosis]CPA59191.1 Uncharacterised protein [Mycobacterium tuberculosis]